MTLFFWKFIPAKPTALNNFFLRQNVEKCSIYLRYKFRFGDHSARKVPQLAQTFATKIGKPRLISMSQKINTIIDFFRYKKIHKKNFKIFHPRGLDQNPRKNQLRVGIWKIASDEPKVLTTQVYMQNFKCIASLVWAVGSPGFEKWT